MTNPATEPGKRGPKAGQPTFAQQVEAEGGDEIILARIREGETVTAIMESYGRTRDMMYLRVKQGREERRRAFEEAKRVGAEALVEQAQEIIDKAAGA